MKYIVLFIHLFFSVFLFVGCAQEKSSFPMPSSAKISGNLIKIPFPYIENKEEWELSHNASNLLVIEVSYDGKIVSKFPLEKKIKKIISLQSGKESIEMIYLSHGTIQLDSKKYNITNINLNNDNQSGFVSLKSK
jgi:hypothetical protein